MWIKKKNLKLLMEDMEICLGKKEESSDKIELEKFWE